MIKEDIKKIISEIDKREKEIIGFAMELVNELSETPPGDERAVAKIIQK